MSKIKQVPISSQFTGSYKNFGLYLNQFKAIPNMVDGLIMSHRRLLMTAYITCRQKFTKTCNLMATTVTKYHPHSPEALQSAVTNLVQAGMMTGQGNFGDNAGFITLDEAAPRYTEVHLSKLAEVLFFKYIDDVPMEVLELNEEPLHLSALLPGCFINWKLYSYMGFAYKTVIPSFTLDSLLRYIIYGERKLKLDLDLDITRFDKSILTEGYGQIKGTIKYKYIKKERKFILFSKPPFEGFNKLISNLEEIEDKVEVFDVSHGNETRIEITCDKPKTVTLVKNILSYEYTYNCDILIFNHETLKIERRGVYQLLDETFAKYKRLRLSYYNRMIKKTDEVIDKITILMKIKHGILNNQLDIKNKAKFIKDAAKICKVTQTRIVEVINKRTITALIDADDIRDALLERKNQYLSDMKDSNISSELKEDLSKVISSKCICKIFK